MMYYFKLHGVRMIRRSQKKQEAVLTSILTESSKYLAKFDTNKHYNPTPNNANFPNLAVKRKWWFPIKLSICAVK